MHHNIDLRKVVSFLSDLGFRANEALHVHDALKLADLTDENFAKLLHRLPINDESSTSYIKDDFGTGLLTTGNIGELGWSFTSLTPTFVNIAGRTGVLNCQVGVATGVLSNPVTASMALHTADSFDVMWKVRIPTSLVLTALRFGLFNGAVTGNPPTDGIYFERLAADTNWFGVNRAGGVETRTDTEVALVADAWYTLSLHRRSANAISFTVNNGRELDNFTNIPSVGANYVAQIINAAGTKDMQIDFFENLITNLAR